jgi:hypothetical protein
MHSGHCGDKDFVSISLQLVGDLDRVNFTHNSVIGDEVKTNNIADDLTDGNTDGNADGVSDGALTVSDGTR